MSMIEVVPVLVVLVILGTVAWVYQDATARAAQGAPVVFSAGSIHLDSPQLWALVCLVFWIICFPLYLASRRPN